MGPEDKARERIDELLAAAGWHVQERLAANLGAGPGVAIREFQLMTGPVDYLLFVDRVACGVIEAKPEGTTLSGVAEQTARYQDSVPPELKIHDHGLRFAYESTGTETLFRDEHDPTPRSRNIFSFHRPETLREWLAEPDTLRDRLKNLPELVQGPLRDCQFEAIHNLEHSFAEARPRALIQMASGGGKTFTSVSFAYRLIKHGGARRVLFLVDRNNLGRQALREFQAYATPDDGRKFTELYNVQHLRSNTLDPVCRVVITTIQRLYSMLRGEPELDPELEEKSQFDTGWRDERSKDVAYSPRIPVEYFDFIITDECHRSIYNLWRQVLEYFDAFLIGLTATPSKQTLGFFNQNIVAEYSHEQAVGDGVNVGYDIYRLRTRITDEGSKVDAGFFVDRRDKLTRRVRWEQLDDELAYTGRELDRAVVAPDQIRTILATYRDKLFTDIFPGRTEVPKTLIFAKDDSHAEDIVHIAREVFGKGNDFCKKITYRTTGEKPEDLIASFRNSYWPRIAVTVDMISTGTDIRPLECLIFMRDVRSPVYFDQMKGRGMRVIDSDELQSVTPDARHKTHFVVIDAVGVFESDKTPPRSLERKRTVSFEKLLDSVALGNRDEDTLTTLAGRLARLDRGLTPGDRQELEPLLGGRAMNVVIKDLLEAVDPDTQEQKARELFKAEMPTAEQVKQTADQLVVDACNLFDNPVLRGRLVDLKKRNDQTIDTVSQDEVTYFGPDKAAADRASTTVASFKEFIEEHKDELTALQLIYSRPFGQRSLTYEAIKELAEAIEQPPLGLTTDQLWQAYERLDKARVRKVGPHKLLTNIISLVRFAIGEVDALEPFAETVNRRYTEWLATQLMQGRRFSEEQMEWLAMVKDHIAASLRVTVEDLEYAPFHERGGPLRANQAFGGELDKVLAEMNEALAG